LGATRSETADARVIVATHQDLSELTRQGRFREDLYYRVNVVRVVLPPLRRRKEDIPLLVEQFINRFDRIQDRSIQGIAAEALSLLMAHDWPGNVRELENVIERAFILCREELIGIEHLPESLTIHHGPKASGTDIRTARDLLEGQTILKALQKNSYNRLAAARELGIHKSTLFRKMKRLGLSLPAGDGRTAGARKQSHIRNIKNRSE